MKEVRKTVNLNLGVLGHIDSGKTSLAKALSTVGSTAAFDKNPQSQERGITIDLGFSSFSVPRPDHWGHSSDEGDLVESLQLTLVDCPGHASLIRTIIGGAQIIDMMMLVVDVVKGIQTQTAECLVIGEITCDRILVVLNKIDLIPVEERDSHIEKMSKRILKSLEKTKFKDSPIIPVSAKPGGSDGDTDGSSSQEPIGLSLLIETLRKEAFLPKRNSEGAFLFAVDHCFSIRGQGTVMTGTVVQGSVKVNETLEIPSLRITKKVKSVQMFKKPVEEATQGDRVGICVTQFDPKSLERGIASAPGLMNQVHAIIARVHKINYFKANCRTKSKFHLTLMHETVMAKVSFFSGLQDNSAFDFNAEYKYLDQMEDSLEEPVYALIEPENSVITNFGALLIASKLDSDIQANVCRLAFYGNIAHLFKEKDYRETSLSQLKVFKNKSKEGVVERFSNEYEAIVKTMFKKETNLHNFIGLKVNLSSGDEGVIEGSFGQSGKVKVRIPKGLSDPTLLSKGAKKGKGPSLLASEEPIKIWLHFKRYIYDKNKKMIQTKVRLTYRT